MYFRRITASITKSGQIVRTAVHAGGPPTWMPHLWDPDVSAKCADVKLPHSRERRGNDENSTTMLKVLANSVQGSEDRPRGLRLLRGATGASDQTRKLMWPCAEE